jgi:hypothetical protein
MEEYKMKKLYLFTRPEDIRCTSYKNFATRYNLDYILMEQGDHEAEKLALELKVHNVPQFVIKTYETKEQPVVFDFVEIDKLVELVDSGEFVKDGMQEEEQKEEDVIPEDIKDFYS